MRAPRRFAGVVFFGLALVPATALAQNPQKPPKPPKPPPHSKRPLLPPGAGGHGQGTAGRTELPVPAVGGGTGSPTSAVVLAAWLDDAETLAPGAATIGLSIGRAESLDGGETDAPVVNAAVGVSSRLQLSGSLPFYWASYNDGYAASGRGNTYLAAKAKIMDPNQHKVGLAVAPMLEILSDASVSDTSLGLSRVNWALPVSVQVTRGLTRVFATTGYFSRGAVFLAGALERALSPRVTVTGALSYMHTTGATATSDLSGLSRSRLDATASLMVRVSPSLFVSGAAGRTISSLDQNGATLLASANISYAFSRAPRAQP
jgi:hypothetical protein